MLPQNTIMCLYMYVNKSVNVYRLEIMAALQELLESSEVADEDAAPVKLFLPQAFYKASFQPRWVKSVGAGDEDDEDDEEDQPSVNPDRLAREFLMNRADNTSGMYTSRSMPQYYNSSYT